MGVVYAIFSKFGEWLIPIHDNLLIAAHDPEDLFTKIKKVYKECAAVGVQLNIKKCQVRSRIYIRDISAILIPCLHSSRVCRSVEMPDIVAGLIEVI